MGNAPVVLLTSFLSPVHPHGCGERPTNAPSQNKTHGSSPRLWGTPSSRRTIFVIQRFIPTAVGNALAYSASCPVWTVHPHGCGERSRAWHIGTRYTGSSPRLWGTRLFHTSACSTSRFIPTAVGNATRSLLRPAAAAVHPHGCGERPSGGGQPVAQAGSSPRLWGTLKHIRTPTSENRFIPTAVGNAENTKHSPQDHPVHPHGCGERNNGENGTKQTAGSSPRLWGTHQL